MRLLAWLLIHHPRTLALVTLERALKAELALRVACGQSGQPSPHQPGPGSAWIAAAVVIAGLAAWILARPL